MTHRIDIQRRESVVRIVFQGRLDRTSQRELGELCRAQLQLGLGVRVRLAAGTQVEPEVLDALVRMEGVLVEAESPYLSRWLLSCLNRNGSR